MGNVWGDIKLRTPVPDAVFRASVNAVGRKYLTGQVVLAVDIENESWLPRSIRMTKSWSYCFVFCVCAPVPKYASGCDRGEACTAERMGHLAHC